MPELRPKFTREPASHRKDALIQAALSLISEQGMAGATVRAIAKRADVTQGLIRHYFSSKEELISAAYECHMNRMTELTFAPAVRAEGSAKARLVALIVAGLVPPVVDSSSVALWAGFISKIRNDDAMRQMHEKTYYDFRDRLETLISAALREANRLCPPRELHQMAIASNAVIDGLWMEGGALPDAFAPGELSQIGLKSVGAIIGLDLTETKGQL